MTLSGNNLLRYVYWGMVQHFKSEINIPQDEGFLNAFVSIGDLLNSTIYKNVAK